MKHTHLFRPSTLLATAVMICLSISAALATTYTINGGDISVAANWSPSKPDDLNRLGQNDIVNINGNAFLQQYTYMTLNAGATLNINAVLKISGGLSNLSGAVININSGGDVQHGDLAGYLSNSGTINNSGYLSTGRLTNTGTLNNNSGGNLFLANYPTTFPGGTFNWNSGSTVTISAYTSARYPNGDLVPANLVTNALLIPAGCTLQVNGTLTLNGSSGTNWTLYNFGNVNNNGTINIGSTSNVSDNGIVNVGTFNNNTNAKINIDRTLDRAMENYGIAFNNSGRIIIGANASVGFYGIVNRTIFNNNAGGHIEVGNAGGYSLLNIPGHTGIDGTFTNSGTLINNGNLVNNTTFNLNSGGNLVLNTNPSALPGGTFNWNSGSTLTIGTTANLFTNALLVPNGCTLQVNGTLTINGTNGTNWTLYNFGNVNNNGTINIGSTSSVAGNGIVNVGSFTNNTGARITIDRTSDRAIDNYGTVFNNSGSIIIGAAASVGNHGLINQTVFNNNSGGEIQISNSNIYGFNNYSGTFTNSGLLSNNSAYFRNLGTLNLNSGGNLVLNTNQANWPDATFNWNSGGTVTIGPSGTFTLASSLSIPSGRTLAVNGTFTIPSGSTLNSNGVLAINSGGTMTNNGTLKGTGTLSQSGTYAGGTTGSIAPGTSPGRFNITGNLDLGANTYNCETNGITANTHYDVLAISGTANLTNSKLAVDWGTFVPAVGNTFTVMQYGSHTGEFAAVTIPSVTGLTFTMTYGNNSVIISAIAKQTIPWAGTANSDWNNPSNWGGGVVPSPTDTVTFPSGTTPYTVVMSSPVVLGGLTLGSNCTLTLGSSSSLSLNGTFNLDSGATLNLGASTVSLNGNWNNHGTLNAGTGKFVLNGVTQQTMYGSTFNDLEIDNPAGVVMLTEENVNGILTFTSGNLILGAHNLNLGSSASVSGADATKFIVTNSTGKVNRAIAAGSSFQFPVGAMETSYDPLTIELASGDPTETFGVRVEPFSSTSSGFASVHDTSKMVKRLWDINEGTAGGNNAKLTFQWNSTESGTNLGVSSGNPVSVDVHRYDLGTSAYRVVERANGPMPGASTLTATTIGYSATSFSAFIIADPDPVIQVTTASADFGPVELGSSASQPVVVKNFGPGILNITATTLAAGEFAVVSGGALFSLAAGDSQTVLLSFTPTSAPVAAKTATLTIQSNDPTNGSVQVQLSGKGIPALAHAYVLLADRGITIDGQQSSSGNIHSNDELEFKKGKPSVHTGNLTAVQEIEIERDNTINGTVTAGVELEISAHATINGAALIAPVAVVPIPPLSFSAGSSDITVGNNQTQALAPGAYRNVKLEQGATLNLTAGQYFMKKLELKKNATLSVDITNGPVTVNVVEKLSFDKDVHVSITPLGADGSRWLTFNSMERSSLKIDKNSVVYGSIIAPQANVQLDKNVTFKGSICARKIDIDKDGTFMSHTATSSLARADAPSSGSPVLIADTPTEFSLAQNYPNPFNPTTEIKFSVETTDHARLEVYNIVGQRVVTLFDGVAEAGQYYKVRFDAGRIASGVYFYRLQSGKKSELRKLLLLK